MGPALHTETAVLLKCYGAYLNKIKNFHDEEVTAYLLGGRHIMLERIGFVRRFAELRVIKLHQKKKGSINVRRNAVKVFYNIEKLCNWLRAGVNCCHTVTTVKPHRYAINEPMRSPRFSFSHGTHHQTSTKRCSFIFRVSFYGTFSCFATHVPTSNTLYGPYISSAICPWSKIDFGVTFRG